MRARCLTVPLVLVAGLAATGCSSSTGNAVPRADAAALADSRAPDATRDTGARDVARIALGDGAPLADSRAIDAFVRDAGVGHDASDASVRDAAHDAPRDVASDAPANAAHDAGVDADTCSDGTPIAYTRMSCPGNPARAPMAFASAATTAAPGDVVSMAGLDEASLPCFPVRVCVPATAPTLLFSDDPESPSSDGVLYADELVRGNYRAYVYHTNAGTPLRSFAVVLLNQGTTTVHARLTNAGIAGPSTDYVYVGKVALQRWFDSPPMPATVDVPPGERVLLSTSLAALQASTNDLVHAILDFSVDGPVKLSVVSILATEDATTITAGLSLLPDDGVHTRGSFPGAALEIESLEPLDGAGVRHLRLGADVTDRTLAGHDYVDGTSVTLGGNYGVSYAVLFALAVPTGLLLSPQGGSWGGVSTVAFLPGSPVLLPSSEDALGTQTDAIMLGGFGGLEEPTVAGATFFTAGGSNLPIDLVTLPTLNP